MLALNQTCLWWKRFADWWASVVQSMRTCIGLNSSASPLWSRWGRGLAGWKLGWKLGWEHDHIRCGRIADFLRYVGFEIDADNALVFSRMMASLQVCCGHPGHWASRAGDVGQCCCLGTSDGHVSSLLAGCRHQAHHNISNIIHILMFTLAPLY